jgi:threonylcarbamoyladenosine tRNA methylthiotransferase MtaB
VNKTVALHTLGCKLNYAETSTIGRQFVDRGFEIVDFTQPSDVYILNTCSVTERAERECRQIVRRALRQSPDAFVIVVGCYAQLRADEIASIEGVDLVLGTKEKFNILEHAGRFEKSATPQVFVSCIDESVSFAPSCSADAGGRTRAFLKIQDGCDFQCSFCTIPRARGTSRSQPADAVLHQAQLIAEEGFREIVLTGVNVGDYGRKESGSLLGLLKQLGSLGGVERIRISSIEPNLLSRELVDFILASEKFCNHFHIPLQSGSNQVLHCMRRRYRTDHYRSVVDYIKQKDPDAGIGADVIVGFPGESEQLFEETCSFIGEIPVSYLHVFTFSEREGTPAANYKGSVEPRERARRSELLRMLGRRKRRDFYSRFGGRTLPVLFEGRLRGGMASGLAGNYVRVGAPSRAPLTNQIRNIAIRSIDDDVCIGAEVQ